MAEMNASREERDEIQRELHVELLPGTEIMADIGSHHFIKSGDNTHRVLVPQPSEDANDPLNWSPFWKTNAMFAVQWMTFTQGFAPLSLAPMFPFIMEEYKSSLADVVQFTGVTILVLGFSNFIWVPIATSFGRRPVLILSQLICLASHIMRAKATVYNAFMAACVLNGIGAGPAETLAPAVIADIFFLHDRGSWNTLYWVVYMGSLMVAPIIAGAMADRVGWHNFWYLNVGITCLSLVHAFVGFPETKWRRSAPSSGDAVLKTTAGVVEKTTTKDGANLEQQEKVKADGDVSDRSPTTGAPLATTHTHPDPFLGKGKPGKKQWLMFQPNAHPFKSIILDLWMPWKLLVFPIVLFASFVVSWSCSNFLILNLTQSQVFAPPVPYGLSPESVGFTNFAILVGAGIGLVSAGPLSDWVSARATARNGGIREPEMRLPTMIPYLVILIFGNIMTAVGYERQWPWPVIVVLGYTCAGIQVAALPSIASTYAVDSYKPAAGSLFVAITVNKNLWGYGMGKFITPWTEESGFYPAFFTNMALTVVWCLFGIIFYYYGKTFRRWTKDSNAHKME